MPTAPSPVVCVVLAAGEGRRYGGPKQLAELAGRPLLEHVLAAGRAARGVDALLVVVGARADVVTAGARLDGVDVVRCPDWQEGMSASLRAGLRAAQARGATTVVVLLADQPGVRPAAIERTLATAGSLVRGVYDGRPGHPVVLRGAAIDRIAGGSDEQRRALMRDATVVELGDLGGGDDVDRPEDLVRLRRAQVHG